MQVDKNNNINQNNQLELTNDLSRCGYSVTLCKKILLKKIIYYYSKYKQFNIFGGAKSYSSNYDIKNDKNDTYIFKIQENT